MKSYVAIGALLAALTSAQSIGDLPTCSLTCIVNGVSGVGCSATDFACSCGKSAQLSASVTPCVQSACSAADQQKVITVLEGICKSVGITITLGTGGATSSAAPPASSSAAPPASSSSEAAPPASSSGSGSGSYSSAAPASSSACTTSTTYTTVTASSGSYPTYGSNSSVTSSPPPAYTGAASANSAVFGVAGLFGLLAYVL